MAEFQEVMRQWNRMCGKQRQCNTCPADGLCSPVTDLATGAETMTALEETIMGWAEEQPEEHPEPVYPTFREWLLANHIIADAANDYATGLLMRRKRIPADIAQKLGLKPKEE